MKKPFSEILSVELTKVLYPLSSLDKAEDVKNLFKELGYDIDISQYNQTTLDEFQATIQLVTDLLVLVDNLIGLSDNQGRVEKIKEIVTKGKEVATEVSGKIAFIKTFIASSIANVNNNDLGDLPKRIVDHLLKTYLDTYKKPIYASHYFLGIVDMSTDSKTNLDYSVIHWNKFGSLVSDPISLFNSLYNWDQDFTSESEEFLKRLEGLVTAFGIAGGIYPQTSSVSTQLGNPANTKEIRLPLYQDGVWPDNWREIDVNFSQIPKIDNDNLAGLYIYPYFFGGVSLQEKLSENWKFDLKGNTSFGSNFGLSIRPPHSLDVNLDPSMSGADFKFDLTITREEQDDTGEIGKNYIFGNEDQTHLALQKIGFRTFITKIGESKKDLGVEMLIEGLTFELKAGEGDGFINKVLPGSGIKADFDITLGYSITQGFYFDSGASFDITIPLQLNLGPVEIKDILVGLLPKDGSFGLNIGTSIKAELGPFKAVIKNIGLANKLVFPETTGSSFSLPDLKIGFKPPSGIGLSIDADVVKGGGYIELNPDKGEYFGVLELTVKETISLKAIGLLNTIMPDGSKGFSLYLLVTAEFSPIQLGFGFTLNGVGGLVGVNRTMNLQALRTGVKTGAVDSIMFPDDPVNNAPQIISDLQNVFPVEEGRYTFGLMGIIGWGTPTLIELEMGLILEVPSPVRLAILGVLRAILPDKNKTILKLQVNFVGTIDFEQKFITFDASLFDSKLLTWTLTGDMAVRIKGGDDPNFVFTIGGFHPNYTPPTGLALPSLDRLTISLLSGNNPRLTIESYFAVTSNTVQFGARLDFYYKVSGKFHVKGWMGFDALFQFSPFYFNTSFSAGLGVYRGNTSLLSLTLSVMLEGPTPWHAKGTATFKILFFKGKVKFDKTWGSADPETLPAKLILPLLEYELGITSNWSAIRSAGTTTSISLRDFEELEDDTVNLENKKLILYPNDTLQFTQKLIPLGLNIDKIGNQSRADSNAKFDIRLKDKDGNNVTGSNTQEQFAPAQYFETGTGQQLGKANFEKHKSGSKLLVDGYGNLQFDYLSEREVEYEKVIIDNKEEPSVYAGLSALNTGLFATFSQSSSAARSSLSASRKANSVLAPRKVQIAEQYAVVNSLTGEQIDLPQAGASYQNLSQGIDGLVKAQPELEGLLEVIPQHELI